MAKSGVNQNLYSPYSFADHIWSQYGSKRDDLLELTKRCVKFDTKYYLKLPKSGSWVEFSSPADAKKFAKNTWLHGHLSNGQQINSELINTFFEGSETSVSMSNNKVLKASTDVGSCPYVMGKMVIPYGPQYITYKNLPYVNVADMSVVVGDAKHVDLGLAILLMIYRSLCNGPEINSNKRLEAADLLEQILTNKYSQLEFRFVMNWLAAIVQEPGINLQTNLWIVGQQQGIGKGTLVDVLKAVIGANLVGSLNQTEIEAGWNDHLFGKAFIEVNEFDSKSSKMSAESWDKWIKNHTCEPELPIRVRNGTSFTTLNIGNYIFTSNDETPVYLDSSDRRNMIVKTTDDPFWKDYASEVKRKYVTEKIGDVAKGFAWILEQVQVDKALIMSAPMTQAKANIQGAHKSKVEEWAFTDASIDRGVWLKSSKCLGVFRNWLLSNYPKESMSETAFGREMGKLVSNNMVEKKRAERGQEYQFPAEMARPQPVSHRADAADALGKIVGEECIVQNYDAEIEAPEAPKPMTKMEKMRFELAKTMKDDFSNVVNINDAR